MQRVLVFWEACSPRVIEQPIYFAEIRPRVEPTWSAHDALDLITPDVATKPLVVDTVLVSLTLVFSLSAPCEKYHKKCTD